MFTKDQFIDSYSLQAKLEIADKIIGDIYKRAAPCLRKIENTRAHLIMDEAVRIAVFENQNFIIVQP